MSPNPENPAANPTETPLQGWKEFAAYLERDQRTARRWELQEGLPIRRHRENRRSSVYAYASEIEAWRTARPLQTDAPPNPLWRRPAAWAAIGAVAAALAFIVYGPILNPKDPVASAAGDEMRAEQVWTDKAAGIGSRLSLDGKLLTYTDWSTGELWLRDVATGESRALSNDGPWEETRSFAETSAPSPDGKHVAAAWFNDEIGGYELRLGPIPPPGETDNGKAVLQPPSDQASYVEAVGWLSATKALCVDYVGFSTTRLMIADLDTGSAKPLKTFDWSAPAEVVISPDGRWIAYALPPDPESRQFDIYLLASDGSRESVVVDHPADDLPVAFTPDGAYLLFRSLRTTGQSLWALPIAEGKPAGDARLASPDISVWRNVGITPEGDLYYLKRYGSRSVFEARLDLASGRLIKKATPISSRVVANNIDPRYSPDGNWMAYLADRALHPFGGYDSRVIVLRDLASGQERDLKPSGLGVSEINWSLDSSSLLFRGRDGKGRFGAYQFGVKSSEPTLLFPFELRQGGSPRNFGWMPDGRSIFYKDAGGNRPYLIRDLESGETRPLIQSKHNSSITLSPDGSRFARMEHGYDDKEVLLSTFDAQGAEERELLRIPVRPGECCPPLSTAWTPDGEAILFWRSRHRAESDPMSGNFELWVAPANGEAPRKTEFAVENLARPNMTVSLSPDGERITFSAGDSKEEIWKLTNFLSRLQESD